KAFEKLLRLLALPVFFELLSEFDASDDTAKSRKRPMLIVDDTKSEKYGDCMEFIHKLFDHAEEVFHGLQLCPHAGGFRLPETVFLRTPGRGASCLHSHAERGNEMRCFGYTQISSAYQDSVRSENSLYSLPIHALYTQYGLIHLLTKLFPDINQIKQFNSGCIPKV
ncbi:MAG: hypothetical protein GY749_28830, partial [Desulfobacteraceae bacterium]|nr:hypothetical protein [Desulfobacteraceae bacterium]